MPFFSRDDFRGVPSNRVRRPWKRFEALLDDLFGERIRADGACGVDLWCALSNVEWRSPEGQVVSYSFRQACDVVAWVREECDGFEWYCSGEPGIVAEWIASGLSQAGWSPIVEDVAGHSGDTRRDQAQRAIAEITALGEGHSLGGISLKELRDEGRR